MILRKLIITSTLILASIAGTTAIAQGGFHGGEGSFGGFQGPNATPTITTVAQALNARDDSMVLLRGHITERVNSDNYMFKDDTGSIRVEIDHDKWAGQNVTPETLVEIWGEVDKGRYSIEVDVKSIRVIQ